MCTSIFFDSDYQDGLARGAKGAAVRYLQHSLAYHSVVSIDEDFGPTTERLLKEFQTKQGLTPSGVVDAATAAKLAGYPANWGGFTEQALKLTPQVPYAGKGANSTQRRLIDLYNRYNPIIKEVPASAFGRNSVSNILYSIIVLECGPAATTLVGGIQKPVIRFENHLWWDNWGKAHPTEFSKHWAYDTTGKRWEGHTFDKKPFHGSQELEWAAYAAAAQMDSVAAGKSMSIGLGQILGSYHKRLYYSSPDAMLAGFYTPEKQLLGMLDFITTDNRLVQAISKQDWYQFAYVYNGPGKPQEYSKQLESIHTEAAKLFVS